MAEVQTQIEDLAKLMDEFGLAEARIKGDGWSVEFSRKVPRTKIATYSDSDSQETGEAEIYEPALIVEAVPVGTPVSSPMMGVYYSSPSPGAPAFVKEGESVVAGQVVGLIEAMKVFNEITAPVSGRVLKVIADNGQLVQPGEPLLTIG